MIDERLKADKEICSFSNQDLTQKELFDAFENAKFEEQVLSVPSSEMRI